MAARWLTSTHLVPTKSFGIQEAQKSKMEKQDLCFVLPTSMAHNSIKEQLTQMTITPIPISNDMVAKFVNTVVTCLVGNQLLRAILWNHCT